MRPPRCVVIYTRRCRGCMVSAWAHRGEGVAEKQTRPEAQGHSDIYPRSRNQSVRRGATKVTEGVCDIESGKISNPRREVAVYKAGEFRCPNCGKLLCCGSSGGVARGLSIRCRCHTEVWIEYGGAAD